VPDALPVTSAAAGARSVRERKAQTPLGSTGETPGRGQTFGTRKGLAFGIREDLNFRARPCSPQPFARARKVPAPSALRKRRLVNPVPIARIYTIENAFRTGRSYPVSSTPCHVFEERMYLLSQTGIMRPLGKGGRKMTRATTGSAPDRTRVSELKGREERFWRERPRSVELRRRGLRSMPNCVPMSWFVSLYQQDPLLRRRRGGGPYSQSTSMATAIWIRTWRT